MTGKDAGKTVGLNLTIFPRRSIRCTIFAKHYDTGWEGGVILICVAYLSFASSLLKCIIC